MAGGMRGAVTAVPARPRARRYRLPDATLAIPCCRLIRCAQRNDTADVGDTEAVMADAPDAQDLSGGVGEVREPPAGLAQRRRLLAVGEPGLGAARLTRRGEGG